jgi:hypothetical protein
MRAVHRHGHEKAASGRAWRQDIPFLTNGYLPGAASRP